MGWKGAGIGAGVGFVLGHGLWGAIFGAWLGYGVEEEYLRKRALRGRNGRSAGRQDGVPPRTAQDPLSGAYACLGAHPFDSDEVLRRKYRELAKRYHPDVLRAQGRSEAEIGKATERMSRINAAWASIREHRGLH